MESHYGFRFTIEQVNEHRRQQGDVGVSRYAVMAAFYRLDPKIDVLSTIVSGGHNKKLDPCKIQRVKADGGDDG